MNFIPRYTSFLKKFLDVKKPLRVVFDFSNGPTALIVPKLLAGSKNIVPIYVDRLQSGNFPAHGPNPIVRVAKLHLSREILQHRADLGVIFDEDGDRAFFMDGRGHSLEPQMIAHLFFVDRQAPFVADEIVYTLLRKEGLINKETHICRVGSIFIKRLMKAQGASVGVEYSGHCYFKEFFYVDSGIMAAIQGINAVSRLPYSLADYYDFFPKSEFHLWSLPAKHPREKLERMAKKCSAEGWGVNRLDGVLCDGGNAWVHARASNTEPLVRIFLSGHDKKELKKLARWVKRVVK
ncbi:MAG: hypothetical protein AAB631_02350 [Patescibacteria group bacterium]